MTLDAGVAIIFVLVVIVIALLALTLLFRASWRVAEPDEALIISGLRASGRPVGTGESMGFNIVTGRGVIRPEFYGDSGPWIQAAVGTSGKGA
jgi:uncharacterized membrane protein YqiK